MINLKTLFFSFFFSVLFINCSLAQEKTLPPPPPPAMNVKADKFESIGGNFSIDIFQAPSQTRDLGTEAANKKGIDVGKLFIWQFPERALFTVMYKNAFDSDGNPFKPSADPKAQNLRDFEAFKEGARRGIVNNNGKVISEKSISFNNYPGTEFRYMSSEGFNFIGRVYLIDGVGYQVVGAYKDDEIEKEVLKVLDSFKLLTATKPNKN